MPALPLNPRSRTSTAADALGGSVELAAIIGIPLAIVVFIAIVLVIYSSKSSSKEKEPEVREVSRDTMYDRLAKEQRGQISGGDDDLDDEHERTQMGAGRSVESESEGLLTAPQPSRARGGSGERSDDYRA
ncbi:hypothetical protein QBC40DRAFT_266646 [Triangularia verruculosa]|uniref:Uncharacterized protein n=1 Tax=Triangularia verruculosa TaxID=2587418 RepID=A0AAN6XDH1_9PEZI|nr:hypothetical protein QBC40DRAFT_266646 [Triangularia verruculosa]